MPIDVGTYALSKARVAVIAYEVQKIVDERIMRFSFSLLGNLAASRNVSFIFHQLHLFITLLPKYFLTFLFLIYRFNLNLKIMKYKIIK